MADQSVAFSWRHAIAKSKLDGEARHLMLTLSLYMNEMGEGAYPALETLAADCGKSVRWAKKWMKICRDDGWIKVKKVKIVGEHQDNRGWRRNQYFASWPERKLDVECTDFVGPDESISEEKGGAPGALPSEKGGARNEKGGAPEGKKVVHHVHTNSPKNQSKNLSSTRAQGGADEREKLDSDFEKLIWHAWETFDPKRAGSKPYLFKQFEKLTQVDRDMAVDTDRIDAFHKAMKADGRTFKQNYCTYVSSRHFESPAVDKILEQVARQNRLANTRQLITPFGKKFMAYRLWLFKTFKPMEPPDHSVSYRFNHMIFCAKSEDQKRFPYVGWLDFYAAKREEIEIPEDHEVPECNEFVSTPVDSELFKNWKKWHDDQGFPWIAPERWRKYVYLPPEVPTT